MSAIVISNLTKKFRRQLVFNDFNLEVFDGEIFSVMGLKGSGKTTLARMLLNFYKPNRGSITIFDMDAERESKSVKEFTSYIPEDVWVYDNLKPMAIFKHTLAFHGLKNTDDIQFLMEYFELDNKHKFIDLTDSERKRVSIINALITKPKLLIIDNPSKDLTHGMVEKLFTHLKRLQSAEELSVLLLTDDLAIGQRYGDRGAYLSGGRLIGLEYLKDKKNNDKVLHIYDELVSVSDFKEIGADLLKDESGDVEFFYEGYLPTLTTVLHQQKIKNYTLEDALLANKIDAFSGMREVGERPQRTQDAVDESENQTDLDTEETILAYDADALYVDDTQRGKVREDLVEDIEVSRKDAGALFDGEDVAEEDVVIATEATAKFVVHRASGDAEDAEKNIQPADTYEGVEDDPYQSDTLIHDKRKAEPVKVIDDEILEENKYDFNSGKEED